jgi:hypothetical protein
MEEKGVNFITYNGQVYEPCGLTHGQSNEVQSNN